jgi:hypothetical protein
MSATHRLAAAEWTCKQCGADLQAACDPLQPNCRIDAELVAHRLERAGATLLAMRTRSPYPAAYRCALPDVLRDIYDTWDWIAAPGTGIDSRPPIPNAAAVSRMETTMAWLQYIPQDRHIVRRIVAVRCLTNPTTGRHIVHWRKLGEMLHCSHEAARNWHGRGITMIVDRLRL